MNNLEQTVQENSFTDKIKDPLYALSLSLPLVTIPGGIYRTLEYYSSQEFVKGTTVAALSLTLVALSYLSKP